MSENKNKNMSENKYKTILELSMFSLLALGSFLGYMKYQSKKADEFYNELDKELNPNYAKEAKN